MGSGIAFTLAVAEKPEPDASVKMNLYVMNADGSGCKEGDPLRLRPARNLARLVAGWKVSRFHASISKPRRAGGNELSGCVTDLTGFWPVAPGMWPSWTPDSQVVYSAFADDKGTTTEPL